MSLTWFATLCVGFLIGLCVGDFGAKRRYQRLLAMCSRLGTPEKFADGRFYYIEEEGHVNL